MKVRLSAFILLNPGLPYKETGFVDKNLRAWLLTVDSQHHV